jgi:hypothetical protein
VRLGALTLGLEQPTSRYELVTFLEYLREGNVATALIPQDCLSQLPNEEADSDSDDGTYKELHGGVDTDAIEKGALKGREHDYPGTRRTTGGGSGRSPRPQRRSHASQDSYRAATPAGIAA